jgi:23S rRNA pseudouridine1911/1915/1917 synthase
VSESIEFTVSDTDAGKRLDRLVIERLGSLGRRGASELFDKGRVRVGRRRVKKGDLARAGDVVSVELAGPAVPVPEPDAPLDVRLERPDLVVVNKPAGIPTAALEAGERGTLVNRLLARYPEMQGIGHRPREPGILHRLDTQTSGLLVAARTSSAFTHLQAALDGGKLQKRYLAIISGTLDDSGVIDAPLAPDPKHRERVRVLGVMDDADYFRDALTHYRVLERIGQWTLLELDVSKAFRHQIRAHLASIGAAIVGDKVYGGILDTALGERHALHASYVAWAGDGTVAGFAVEEPLPKDMAELLGG